jgi:hypothetical protein
MQSQVVQQGVVNMVMTETKPDARYAGNIDPYSTFQRLSSQCTLRSSLSLSIEIMCIISIPHLTIPSLCLLFACTPSGRRWSSKFCRYLSQCLLAVIAVTGMAWGMYQQFNVSRHLKIIYHLNYFLNFSVQLTNSFQFTRGRFCRFE